MGWGSPKSVRGLRKNGIKEFIVYNPGDIANISEKEGVVIASGVGKKKKKAIITKALEAKVKIININVNARRAWDSQP